MTSSRELYDEADRARASLLDRRHIVTCVARSMLVLFDDKERRGWAAALAERFEDLRQELGKEDALTRRWESLLEQAAAASKAEDAARAATWRRALNADSEEPHSDADPGL